MIASTFGIELEKHGNLLRQDSYGGMGRTSRPGVFVAGAATGPETIDDSISQGEGAAIAALSVLQGSAVAAE
jgi:heterodisulfide reductase subunit A